mgnify:CR=1 FL=1
MNETNQRFDALALFSGGLDSILAAKVMQDQGKRVLGLHFTSPFFGHAHKVDFWAREYGVPVLPVDVGEDYVRMLARPEHGWGKWLNPCVDCKILMLKKAREMMADFGATVLVSGEVLGQRPMSQRRDALDIISRDAEVRDVLVRPLCARRLRPTPAEEQGLVDRERLLDIGGRGRKEQLALAEHYGFTEVPTPAGGCLLTEKENAARFFQVLRYKPEPAPDDFELFTAGRHFFSGPHWLVIGKTRRDNERLTTLAREGDIAFKVKDYPGPVALARPLGGQWSQEAVMDAAAVVASYSPKAVRSGGEVVVMTQQGRVILAPRVTPDRSAGGFAPPTYEGLAEWKAERMEAT